MMRYTILAALLALFLGVGGIAVSGMAISGSSKPEAVISAVASSVADEPLALFADAPETAEFQTIPGAELPVLLAQASADERPLLEDGIVTRSELESSFLAANQCTVSAAESMTGVVVKEPARGPDNLLRFGGLASPDRAKLTELGLAHDSCVGRYYDHVSAGWRMEAAYRSVQPLWEAIGACLRDKGYDVPTGANWRQLGDAVSLSGGDMAHFRACDDAANRAN